MWVKWHQLAWSTALLLVVHVQGRETVGPIELRETVAVGDQYRVSCRVSLQGTMRLPAGQVGEAPMALPFTGTSQIDYAERILEVGEKGAVRRTFRVYERMDFRRRLGQQEQASTLRAAARRMVVVRRGHLEVPFSPDGPLLWSEIDRVRTDVFPSALVAMLPNMPVKVGEKWLAGTAATLELTDLDKVHEGQLECCLERVLAREGSRVAQVSFQGNVSGLAEDGPTRHQLSGLMYFDLDGQAIVYLSLEGKQSLLDSDGQVVSELHGQFVLTRQRLKNFAALSDEALRGLKLVPDEENTRLLFDEPALGLTFVYPRRWTVRQVQGQQVILDEPHGGTLLIVLDAPGRTPNGQQYQQQVEHWLAMEKAVVHRRSGVALITGSVGKLEHFRFEITQRGEQLILDYYAYQHAGGGATLAARIPVSQAKLMDDVAVIARSLKRTPAAGQSPP